MEEATLANLAAEHCLDVKEQLPYDELSTAKLVFEEFDVAFEGFLEEVADFVQNLLACREEVRQRQLKYSS